MYESLIRIYISWHLQLKETQNARPPVVVHQELEKLAGNTGVILMAPARVHMEKGAFVSTFLAKNGSVTPMLYGRSLIFVRCAASI